MSRIARLLLLPVTAAVCAGVGATAARAAATNVSTNWAGYAVTALESGSSSSTFTRVSARWVAPAATCSAGTETYSAFWVGLGGFSDTSQGLEQIGTEADCSPAGAPAYSMWYELLPAASVPIKLKVVPGNVIAASVTVSGTKVTLKIKNLTRKTSYTKQARMAAPDLSSAEWVAEAPSTCDGRGFCQTLQLTNFGTVSFTRASATASGHTGGITDPSWSATGIELISATGSGSDGRFADQISATGAVPTEPSWDGGSFAIAWQESVTPPDQNG